MTKYSKARKNKELTIQQSIEGADKGKFISHKNMRVWFASLGGGNELSFPKPDIFLIGMFLSEACLNIFG